MNSPAQIATQPRISVIVPTLNEAANIEALLDAVQGSCAAAFEVEMIIVDDGSTDGTRELVRARESAAVRLIPRDASDGLAAAVLEGAKRASCEVLVVMDADLSHPPDRIPQLVAPIFAGTSDMVIGSRYAPGGSTPDWPLVRRVASRAAAVLASPLTDVRDSLSGFFAVRRELLLAAGPEVAGFKIALEILVRGGPALRVKELPIAFRDRAAGKSKMGAGIAWTYIRRLAALSGASRLATFSRRLRIFDALEFLLDLLVFYTLVCSGRDPGSAHLASFAAASALSYALKTGFAFRRSGMRLGWGFPLRFLLVRALAAFLRGGVLGLFAWQWGWPPLLAFLPAIATSALVDYVGNIFYVSPASRRYGHEVAWRLAAVGIVGYAALLRLVYLTLPNLMPEEAYYWNYGQHLAAGYLDHPPMVAWLTRLGTTLFGHDEFGVRIGAFACWAAAALFVYRLTRDLHGKTAAFVAVLLLQTLPIFFSTGLILTPDAPLVACWAGLLYFLHRTLIVGKNSAWWGVGACLGVGMLSKYSIATLGLAGLIFAVFDPPTRAVFRKRTPYFAMLLAAVLFSPVIYWNATHEWASFDFQSSRRLDAAPNFSLHLLLGSVFLLLTPVGAIAAPLALAAREGDRATRFARVFTFVPLVLFALFSLRSRVQLNWVGPLWLALLPRMAHDLVSLRDTRRALATSWKVVFCATPIAAGALLHYLALGLPGLGYSARMELLPIGWDDLGRQVRAISDRFTAETGTEPLLVGMDRYFTSSELAFYAGDGASVAHRVVGRRLFAGISLMYDLWAPPKHQLGQSLVLVAFEKADLEREPVARRSIGLSPVDRGEIKRGGKVVRDFYWRTATQYQRPPRGAEVSTPGNSP